MRRSRRARSLARAREKTEPPSSPPLAYPPRRRVQVVFRAGSPFVPSDLQRVSAQHAKVSVILAPSGDPDIADAETLRAVLALKVTTTNGAGGGGLENGD